MAHVCICSCHCQTVQYTFHIGIVTVGLIIYTQQARIVLITTALVENAQYHVQTVVDITVKTGNLYNDAIMCQTVDKRIWKSFRNNVVVIVKRLVVHIENGLLYVADLMPKKIDCYHRERMAGITHVLRIGIVYTQILTETQSLGLQPRLLKFNQNELFLSVSITHRCPEINTEHRQRITVVITVLMGANLYGHHIHFQKGRQNGTCYALILHQVLEHNIVYRIGYLHKIIILISNAKVRIYFETTKRLIRFSKKMHIWY